MKKILIVIMFVFIIVGCEENSKEVISDTPANIEETPVVSESEEPTVFTIENNEDFAKLLEVASTDIDYVIWFAENYQGKIIEFDGSLQDAMNYKNYKTRYSYLIYADDYEENKASKGPSFKFEDINYQSFNFVGEKPEYAVVGLNVRITAQVEKFNADTGIFFLKPVETRLR